MISTDDGETFVIELVGRNIEVSREELEHIIAAGEIILDELKEFYFEPDTGG